MQTKTKLTVTIDSEVLPRAKEYARSRGVSLSFLIEDALREALGDDQPPMGTSWAAGKTIEEVMAYLDDETHEERQARWEDKSLPFGTRLLGQARPEKPLTDEELDEHRYEYLKEKYG
jgi:post-segregation antitoxin (ccd killing protein)